MSRNGSGTYTLPSGNPVVTGTTITSSWANTTLSDIASSLTGSIASDGQTPMSGSLNMANNKIISVTDPTNAQDAATKAYVDAADTTNLALTLLKANNLSDVANATTARGNLTAAKSGANSDITSITGLTTALTVLQGGTGVTTSTGSGNAVLSASPTFSGTTVIPTTTITTLNAPSGVLATQNGMTGIAKAWVQYAGGTTTIYGSFNVSSVTVLGTGSSQINFTTAMPNTNYAVNSSVAGDGVVSVTYLNGGKSTAITTGYVQIATAYFIAPSSWAGSNPTAVSVSIFSS
jgi:hypothetical protein